jgi:hypothetical protein
MCFIMTYFVRSPASLVSTQGTKLIILPLYWVVTFHWFIQNFYNTVIEIVSLKPRKF